MCAFVHVRVCASVRPCACVIVRVYLFVRVCACAFDALVCARARVCLQAAPSISVGPSHAWHWGNGVFIPAAGVVAVARCYLHRTRSHHESVFDEQ